MQPGDRIDPGAEARPVRAADTRRSVRPHHVGHVLECGALACDPGSPSDCLVAEVYDDGTALFVAPNPDRRCTPSSIAAHSLYEESHPQLQFYPEGILVMEKTEFHARDGRTAAIRNSQFKTLMMPGGMGSTHKVLILGKNVGTPALRGCSFRVRVT